MRVGSARRGHHGPAAKLAVVEPRVGASHLPELEALDVDAQPTLRGKGGHGLQVGSVRALKREDLGLAGKGRECRRWERTATGADDRVTLDDVLALCAECDTVSQFG